MGNPRFKRSELSIKMLLSQLNVKFYRFVKVLYISCVIFTCMTFAIIFMSDFIPE